MKHSASLWRAADPVQLLHALTVLQVLLFHDQLMHSTTGYGVLGILNLDLTLLYAVKFDIIDSDNSIFI